MKGIEIATVYKVGTKLYENFDKANEQHLTNQLNSLFENCNISMVITNIVESEEIREELIEVLVDYRNNNIEYANSFLEEEKE